MEKSHFVLTKQTTKLVKVKGLSSSMAHKGQAGFKAHPDSKSSLILMFDLITEEKSGCLKTYSLSPRERELCLRDKTGQEPNLGVKIRP